MAANTESGHAQNVAKLGELKSSVLTFGDLYNPPKESLKLISLTALEQKGKDAISAVHAAFANYSKAITAREFTFDTLPKLVTRIINSLKACDTTEQVDESAKSIVRKLQGRRASARKTEDEKAASGVAGVEMIEHSSSQMSFDSRLDNFDKLIKLLLTVEQYKPNEADLKVESLEKLLNDLRMKNAAVVTAASLLSSARRSRDEILYKANSGIVDIAMDVKSYIKSLFGASSQQYKQV
jgi:hypothetical protein